MVGDALRIAALGNSYNLLREFKFLFLNHFEIADDIDSGMRCDKGELSEFVILEESSFDLDDSLASLSLAVEVDTDGDLILDAFEVQQIESSVYVFCGNMVQYGSIFQCADY